MAEQLNKFTLKVFKQRERDILDRHRMPLDKEADLEELRQIYEANNQMQDGMNDVTQPL